MELIQKLFKFGIVGLSGVVVDYAVTALCKELLGMNVYIANSLGFVVAAASNYAINRKWTFQSESKNVRKEFATFFLISLVGLLWNNLIIWILTDLWLSITFYIAKFIAIVLVFVWNFGLNNAFNFKDTEA